MNTAVCFNLIVMVYETDPAVYFVISFVFGGIIIAGIIVAICLITKGIRNAKAREEKEKYILKYSDKVKNYHGKNIDYKRIELTPQYYDEYGKMIFYCDDSEVFYTGNNNYLFGCDRDLVKDFINLVFGDIDSDESFINEKIDRLYNCKENKNISLLDIRYFFKNPKYIILPFHITEDKRSEMILYYCQTRAEKCILMPKTKYSSKETSNYLAYFPLNSFDDMCFISYLMIKYPSIKGMRIHGFESAFQNKDLHNYVHDKDFIFEYIFRMIVDQGCKFFPMKNAFVETDARILKASGYPDASEFSSKQAEIKAEMQQKGLIYSGFHNENERKLFFLVKESYPDAVYQYRDEWLEYLSLDIFIPSIRVAIEYQGGQHYKSVKLYGGEKQFKNIQERDAIKKELCKRNHVALIEWKYDEPITKENLEAFIKNII